jgi:hypothetical protein
VRGWGCSCHGCLPPVSHSHTQPHSHTEEESSRDSQYLQALTSGGKGIPGLYFAASKTVSRAVVWLADSEQGGGVAGRTDLTEGGVRCAMLYRWACCAEQLPRSQLVSVVCAGTCLPVTAARGSHRLWLLSDGGPPTLPMESVFWLISTQHTRRRTEGLLVLTPPNTAFRTAFRWCAVCVCGGGAWLWS